MSLNQFAMVEELACLIKDNLPCKHLVLSMEETLVDFLKDDKSSNGVLELEPMNSYNRLLLHRLADIFGFSHQSVGEGDDRHLIFERCPETSVPSILVSDLLWQYDEIQSPSMSHLLVSRRPEASSELKTGRPTCQISLEERESAYLAARERIFSMEEEVGPTKQKPRSNPVVARRMIAHALGQRIETPPRLLTGEEKDEEDLSLETYYYQQQQTNILASSENLTTNSINNSNSNSSWNGKQKVSEPRKQGASGGKEKNEISGGSVQKDNTKEQHIGAAKRMFANALGFHSSTRDMKQQPTKRGSSE